MSQIPKLRETDFLGLKLLYPEDQYRERPTVYAIVFDSDQNIAVIRYKTLTRHPFPGGGIMQGESAEEALKREVLEEIGCSISDIALIGIFDAWSNQNGIYYPTNVYTAKVMGAKGLPTTVEEYEKDAEIAWLPLKEVLRDLGSDPVSLIIREIITLNKLI